MQTFHRRAKTQLLNEDLWLQWTLSKVPTLVSKCPECDTLNIWSTTGIIQPITCSNCKTDFAVDFPKQLT